MQPFSFASVPSKKSISQAKAKAQNQGQELLIENTYLAKVPNKNKKVKVKAKEVYEELLIESDFVSTAKSQPVPDSGKTKVAASSKKSTGKKSSNKKKLLKLTSVAQSKKVSAKPKKAWGISYLHWNSVSAKTVSSGKGKISSINQIAGSYNAKGIKFSLKPSFRIAYNVDTGETKTTMGSTIVEAAKGGLFKLGKFDAAGAARFYIPTSESMRKVGTNGVIYARLVLSTAINSWINFSYTFNPRYYLQTQRVLAEFDEDGRILAKPRPMMSWRFGNEVGLEFKVSDKISIDTSLGVDHAFNYSDYEVYNGRHDASLDLGLFVNFNFIDHFSFVLGIDQSHGIAYDATSFSFLNGDETSYHLIAVFYY